MLTPCRLLRVYANYGIFEDTQRIHGVFTADRRIFSVVRSDRQRQFDLSGAAGASASSATRVNVNPG